MTEHKRLTTKEKHPHGAEGVSKDKLTGKYCRGVFEATACVEKLAEYETAEDEGRLVVLPCKVGDIIFCIVRPGIIRQFKVLSIEIYEYGVILELLYARNVEKYRFWRIYMPSDDFGKKLFLTSEEAEKALKNGGKVMNEFAIEWIKGDDCAGVTAPSGSALKSKLLRYAKERPGEVKIEALNQDGSVFLKIPVCWVKVSPPRKVSEKQREAMGERARKMWEEKRGLEG